MPAPCLYVALVHAPVRNRKGEEIAAQIDTFDFFDMCRLSLTYPIRRFYVVNNVPSQLEIAGKMLAHGMDPKREDEERGVFSKTVLLRDIDELRAAVDGDIGYAKFVATTARKIPGAVTFEAMRRQVDSGEPTVLMFGKAWGFTDAVIEGADQCLEPIDLGTGYNHLSVRSAVAIVLDRLLG